MELLKSAADALQRYFSAVAIYLAASAVLSLSGSAIGIAQLLRNADPGAAPTLASNLMNVAWFTVYSAVTAGVQCIAFSRIGREIDRPLWKVRDDREALGRFAWMWFEFNLVVNAIWWIAGTKLGGDDLEVINAAATLVACGLLLVMVPFGSCQMFFGNFSWSTFGEALGPIARKTGEFLPVFGITLLQFVFLMWVSVGSAPAGKGPAQLALFAGAHLACDVAIGYLDCLVFAAAWLVCKHDRDAPEEIDLDF